MFQNISNYSEEENNVIDNKMRNIFIGSLIICGLILLLIIIYYILKDAFWIKGF